MTPTIAELLLIFSISFNNLKVPQPPERFMTYPISVTVSDDANETKMPDSEKPEKLKGNAETETPTEPEDPDDEPEGTETVQKKTIYTMSVSELNALSLKQKAKLLHMNKKTFKTFVKLVNREAGPNMNDKIMVAAVVWNRKYCKQFPKTVKKVMYEPGQFALRGQKKTVIHGNHNDKEAQLAILLAYRMVHTNQIPHNVLYFNCISYKMGSSARYKRYKHYNNYFVKDVKCKCKWCSECS